MLKRTTVAVVWLGLVGLLAGCTRSSTPGPHPAATDPASPLDPIVAPDDGALSFGNLEISHIEGRSDVAFGYRRQPGAVVEHFGLKAVGDRRTIDLSGALPVSVMARLNNRPGGRVTFPLATRFMPAGRYRLVAEARLVGSGGDGVLIGDGIIYTNPSAVKLTDYTFRYRFASLTGGHSVVVRVQGQPNTSPQSWNFYYAKFDSNGVSLHRAFKKRGQHWQRVTSPVKVGDRDGRWHDVSITCKGSTISLTVDGKPAGTYTDPDNYYPDGGVGFWMGARTCVFDDVAVTDLNTGETVVEDRFDGDGLAGHWSVASGAFEKTPGRMILPRPKTLGTMDIEGPRPSGFPTVTIRREMDASRLHVNGRPLTPLILSFSTLHKIPDFAEAYRLPRRAALGGMPILAPVVSRLIETRPDGTFDFSRFDKAMTQLAMAAPKAWLFPRFPVPGPPSIPSDERLQMAHGPDEPVDKLSKASAMQRFIGASSASTTYRQFVLEHIDEVIDHIRAQPYATRIIGMTITGGGYEGNWGTPSGKFGTIVDISPAMCEAFGRYIEDAYRSEAACAKAWGVESVDFARPPIPNRADRTAADFAGFRDPSRPRSRWIRDFNAFYNSHVRDLTLHPLFQKLHELSPNTFWGRFGLFSFNWHQGAIGRCGKPTDYPLIDNPGMQHVVGCLTYGDRKAGGVSIYTNSAWESLRLRNRIAIGEADIRTVQGRAGHRREASYYDTLQTMRREFGHAVVTERMGVWYYDMWLGWFDHPIFLAEFNAQAAVARRVRETPHVNIAQTLIVSDLGGWRTFASYLDRPMKPDETPPRPVQTFVRMLGLEMDQSMMRVGAPRDKIVKADLWNPELRDYKLYVFKTTYDADEKTRRKIRDLVEGGKTVFMTWAAGLTDESGIGVDRMSLLLGMTVRTDEKHAPMACKTVKLDHPLLRDLPEGTVLGDPGASSVRFWIEESKDLAVLARYSDGKAAVAVKKIGAGYMVYSAVPVPQPVFLRNLAAFAGNHIFTEGDDAFYADNHFIVLHAKPKSAGKRTIRLPRRVGTVYDLVTGEVIATDVDAFTVDLPEKTTGIWYYGDQPERVRGLSLGLAPTEEPEPLKR